jgi:hypothetical protein
MNIFYQILNVLGVNLNTEASNGNTFVLFLCYIVLLSIFIVICLLNVLFYFLIIYLIDDLKLLDSYTNKLPDFVLTIINLYKNTRKLFIVYEVCFALFITFSIIWLCSRIVYGVM